MVCLANASSFHLELPPISEDKTGKILMIFLHCAQLTRNAEKNVKSFLWLCCKNDVILELYLLWPCIVSHNCAKQLSSDKKRYFKQNNFVYLFNLILWSQYLEKVFWKIPLLVFRLNFWKSIRVAIYSWRLLASKTCLKMSLFSTTSQFINSN